MFNGTKIGVFNFLVILKKDYWEVYDEEKSRVDYKN
jgi:hypothetical protein